MTAQLFRGNEYWFWLATDTRGAVITVHVYDSDGKLAESEFWQKAASLPPRSPQPKRVPITPLSLSRSRPRAL